MTAPELAERVTALDGACRLAEPWFAEQHAHSPPVARMDGRSCELDEAIERAAAGDDGYAGGFIDHYIVPIVYPPGLTRGTQIVIGTVILAVNLVIYYRFAMRTRRKGRAAGSGP